jgi:hypothetical protein
MEELESTGQRGHMKTLNSEASEEMALDQSTFKVGLGSYSLSGSHRRRGLHANHPSAKKQSSGN